VIYLDTSYLVKIYGDEPGADDVLVWLEGKSGLVCAVHGRLELFAAFKRHQREGRLPGSRLTALIKQVIQDESSQLLHWLPVSPELITTACDKIAEMPPAVFLRAADALHLAAAADAGLKEIYSHDRHLLAAAPHFGLKGLDVIKPA
jgi:predicted nucleic acid-binding protein